METVIFNNITSMVNNIDDYSHFINLATDPKNRNVLYVFNRNDENTDLFLELQCPPITEQYFIYRDNYAYCPRNQEGKKRWLSNFINRSGNECAICYEHDQECVSCLKCLNSVCRKCVIRIIQESETDLCPMCRGSLGLCK